jgi:hypothetical protein
MPTPGSASANCASATPCRPCAAWWPSGPTRDSVVAALRVLALEFDRSPRPDYRAYQQRLNDHNCQWIAAVHNATTPAQRRVARDRLKGWEADLRSLLPPAAAAGLPSAPAR